MICSLSLLLVIPANAGIQLRFEQRKSCIPAFAGMTACRVASSRMLPTQ